MDEFSDSDSAYTAEAEEGYAEDGGGYEEAGPPDVTEALQQMQATIESRLPAPEDEEEYDDGAPEYGLNPAAGEAYSDEELLELADEYGLHDVEEAEDYDPEELNELIDSRVREAVIPFVADVEMNRRVEALHDLAEDYPELRDPQAIEEVSAEVQRIGEAYGLEAADTDPALVELVLQARAARAYAAAEFEAPEGEAGATLETGVGPSPQTEGVDPQTKAYMDVIGTAMKQRGATF